MTSEYVRVEYEARIKALKDENDKARNYLQHLEAERQKTTNDILIRAGRYLELEDLLRGMANANNPTP